MPFEELPDVDAVVVGAGFSGLFMAKKLLDLGLDVRGFDAGSGVGGVWNWNRYPGARTDSQGHTYCFSTPEMLAGWQYAERFPDQQQVVDYLRDFAARFQVDRYFRFDTLVERAEFDETAMRWQVTTDRGDQVTATYLVTAVGLVSEPSLPRLPGLDAFAGPVHHTSRWPREGVEIAGRRVAVIGTGSSGIQIVPQIARVAEQLTVFQRTPNYVSPSGNRPVSDAEHAEIRRRYDEIWAQVRANRAGHPYSLTGRIAKEHGEAERTRIFEEAWARGGHSMIQATFDDVMSDRQANEWLCEFLRGKIASIVDDPATVAKLTPDYAFGAKRPPIGDGYLESFNLPHVELVDLRREPITQFTTEGVTTASRAYDLDVIVLATGFDASTGAYLRMDITGRGGVRLSDRWSTGPSTLLGLGVTGFPNLFMVAGPQSPFANLPPSAEHGASWIATCIEHMRAAGIDTFEPRQEAEDDWNRQVEKAASSSQAVFGSDVNSWFFGANIEGKPRAVNVYFGGAHVYADLCDAEAAAGYPGFVPSTSGESRPVGVELSR